MSAPSDPRKECACTGVRWCARCRDPERRVQWKMRTPLPLPDLLQPPESTPPPNLYDFDLASQTAPGCPSFTGLRVFPDFISDTEARAILESIASSPLLPSQSGKQKQHFGPKINFNRGRMNAKRFEGIPAYALAIEEALRAHAQSRADESHAQGAAIPAWITALSHFRTTDVFVLRYRAEEASNLDFHVDDTFAYGEVILDLSLEADAVLTFYRGRPESEVVPRAGQPAPEPACVRAQLPRNSLAILWGEARYQWEHALLAQDIRRQRTSITLRTLGDALSSTDEGRAVHARARQALPTKSSSERRTHS